MQDFTQRQRDILGSIHQSINGSGYPPTIREIGTAFGIRSTNGVNDHLKALERKGYIERGDKKSRALALTAPALRALGEAPHPTAVDVAVPAIFPEGPVASRSSGGSPPGARSSPRRTSPTRCTWTASSSGGPPRRSSASGSAVSP